MTSGGGPAEGRVIVALDVDTLALAESLVERLTGAVFAFKVGLELFTACGADAVRAVTRQGGRVMLDLKLHDIPETVARATARAADLGVAFMTLHTGGGRRMMEAAAQAARTAGGATRTLGVTVLTSMEDADLAEVGVPAGAAATVELRARLAIASGLDGVVASPREAAAIRALSPTNFLIVTPGVRPAGAAADDQRRVATPRAARDAGADYLVIGRPITHAADPRAAALAIAGELA